MIVEKPKSTRKLKVKAQARSVAPKTIIKRVPINNHTEMKVQSTYSHVPKFDIP